ncbi:Metallo-dependent phosphatase [Punctularia strigosozonata HHB-11173 SS5]|uniref:Metallo-dependent phosphatase n=1 Tax=Punctularia strigosozonata (strain HHB-11173) TaxID=741275 RepID=UPI0004417082|nr:Metallo-dependent phosphatase [Punctularia strigosozonata HHB-11173 SS5]EIN09401.1 Metallo-dependent phosphatase [Punctularia strigosozonata HHB-11173 SS5]
MARSIRQRFLPVLRAILAPACAIIAFSCLLTFFFVLYQPTRGPEAVQRLGWQAWAVVSPQIADQVPLPNDGSSAPPVQGDVDWWNVTTEDSSVDTANLPLDIWAPLLPHDTGLTELSIERCLVPPVMASGNMCQPPTSPEKDAIKGKWVRVEGNLNAQSGMWYLLLLLPDKQSPPDIDDTWHKVSRSIKDGVPGAKPLYLWYKLGKTMREMTAEDKAGLITELDVLYGEDVPWPGFEKLEPASTEEQAERTSSVHLTYRRGVQPVPKALPLHFSHDGRFKILQVADLHFSVARGKCRDTDLVPCSNSDNLTSTLIDHVLDAEKPDLVVFTGDQLNGQGTSWDSRSVLAKFAKAVIARKIPWAAVFGNHDDETGGSKEYQIKQMQALPYSLVEPGPKDVHGVGNYVLKVKSADPSMMHLLTLYFLDSGAYSKGFYDWFGWFTGTEYDWIHRHRSNLLKDHSRQMEAKTSGTFGVAGGGSGPSARQASSQTKCPDVFPYSSAYNKADLDSDGKSLDVGIHGLEDKGSAKKNEGFFEKGLLQALESEHNAGGNAREVKVVANGHCHITENCRRVRGIWNCFGGGGFDRRFRVYDISAYGEKIETYKRTENDEIIDRMVLSGPGAPSTYEGTR